MDADHRKALEEFVSPSDIPLFDIIVSSLETIETVCDIFADRNSKESAASLNLAAVQSLITILFGIRIEAGDLSDFLAQVIERNSNDKE